MDSEQDVMRTVPSESSLGDERTIEGLEEKIRYARRDMDRVIDELEDRLTPSNIWDKAMDNIKEQSMELASEVGSTTIDFVKEHPIPLAVLGAGAAWLLTDLIRGAASSSSSPAHKASPSVADCAKEAGQSAVEKVGDAYHTTIDKTKEVAEKGGEYIQQGAEAVADAYDRHPLLFVTAAVGAGVALGLALPSTRREDRWMGEYRDRLFERIGDIGEEAVERGKEVVRASVAAGREEAEEQGEALRDRVERESKQVARESRAYAGSGSPS